MYRTLSFLLFVFSGLSASAQLVSVDDAVDMALQKNFDIRAQMAFAEVAFNDNRFANYVFLPQLNGTGSFLKTSNDSHVISFSNVETVRNGVPTKNYSSAVQLLWPVFDGTRMFAVRKGVRETANLAQINIRFQMMNSVAAVVTNYYNIVRQKQQLKAIQELLGVNEERVKLAQKKLQVGTGGKPELLQAKVDYNANRILALQQETLIQQLKDQLNGLLGMALPDVYEIADSIPINLHLSLEEVMSDIEYSNQTLLAAQKNIDIANTVLWQNKASRSPVINLIGAYNFSRTENAVASSPFSLKFSQNKGYNYGMSVSIPILNARNVSRIVNQAQINVDRLKIIYEQQKMVATVGVRNAFTSYENARKALVIEEENILLARENVSIAFESFKMGVLTSIELRTAQQTLADTFSQLILARYNAKAAETELLRLKGALLK